MKIKIVCAECGGDDVRRDATAAWNVETQEWELCGVMDQGYCENEGAPCQGEEVSLDEEELEEEPA